MIRPCSLLAIFAFMILVNTVQCWGQRELVIVVGAAGESEFGEQFSQWAENWKSSADETFQVTVIGTKSETNSDREQLENCLDKIASSKGVQELWLVLIGHGTFDGNTAKFNLKGQDFSAAELAGWLDPIQASTVILNCSSSSSPFLRKLQAPNRVVLAATQSGYQYNFARFGEHLSKSIVDIAGDLDKDGQTSLLEAFIAASAGVKEFYDSENRLATEQAILDDNSDALGTPASWFAGIRAVKRAKNGAQADGQRANQLFFTQRPGGIVLDPNQQKQREALEIQLERLREKKSRMTEDEYYRQLETIMIPLAKLYADADEDK